MVRIAVPAPGIPHMAAQADIREPEIVLPATRAGGLWWRVRRELLSEEFHPVLADPDVFLADPDRRLAHSELITMAVLTPAVKADSMLLLRRLNYGRWRHRLRDIVRPTRAERAFKNGLAMERACVPTPRVVAVGVERWWRWPVRAYLLTEFVPRAQTLRRLLAEQGCVTRKQTRQLAGMMARLHQSGFTHRDLNTTNILFNAEGEPCFIDLDGVRQHSVVTSKDAVRNLTRLARDFTPQDLNAAGPWFLKHYCSRRDMRKQLHTLRLTVGKRLETLSQR